MKALIYTRVSSLNQAEEGTSLETQAEACIAHAEKLGYTVAKVVKEAFSGAYLFDRPLLNEERENIRRGEYDAVVVYAIDRLSRNIAHFAIIVDELERYNTKLIFVTETIDDSPEGRLMMSVKSYAAELEREKIRERCMRGKRAKIAKGELINAGELYGYRYDREAKKRRICKAEAEIVKEIFQAVLKNQSLVKIGKSLNERGILPPSAGKRKFKDNRDAIWRISSLRRILREPAYKGKTYANKFKNEYFYRNGKRVRRIVNTPQSEWIELPALTPAIVAPNTFEAVQKRLSTNRGETTRNEAKPFLLRGLIFCGVCGKKLYPETDKSSKLYRCSSRGYGHTRCGGKQVNAQKVESKIWGIIQKIISDREYLESQLSKYKKEPRKAVSTKGLQKRIATLDGEIKRTISRAGSASNSAWKLYEQEIETKLALKNELEKELEEINKENSRETEKKRVITDLADFYKPIIESADFELKRTILEAFNVRVFANGQSVDIYGDFT